MGLIEICNRLEAFIVDIYGTKDFDNMRRQMEIKDVILDTGENKKVIMLKKGGEAYEANAAYFKIKASAAVDFDGNVYIPNLRDKGGENLSYVLVRKIKRDDVRKMVQEIMAKLGENKEDKEIDREITLRLVR